METRLPTIATLVAAAMLVAACGAEAGGLGGAGAPDDDDRLEAPDDASGSPGGGSGDDDISWSRIEPRFDLVGPRVSYIHDLGVDPDDGSVVLVRFFGGVPECYGAVATVVSQDATEVVVKLEVGNVPAGYAARDCIDIAMAQEIAVTLDRPAGEATLTAFVPEAADAYVGLDKDGAIALAVSEGRTWRIAREDGEEFMLTMDYRPDRINFEIDAGVVTTAWMG